MTKIIKVISAILCAIMVVGCCFVFYGCETKSMPTLEQLLLDIQKDFPEAHINTNPLDDGREICPSVIFFFENESKSEFLAYLPADTSEETSYCNFIRLTSVNNTKKILNTVMPNIIKEWSYSDTDKLIDKGNPNKDFTDWFGLYSAHNWGFYLSCDSRGMWISGMSATDKK